jgi:hypothetical protein
LIEGLMSVAVGLATFFLMPASITETHKILHGKASWLHGKSGWFTEREEKILVNRILRDDPSKGDMNNRQHVDLKGIWSALKDINLWPLYIVSPFNLESLTDAAWNSCIHPISACSKLPISYPYDSRIQRLSGQYARNSRLFSLLY